MKTVFIVGGGGLFIHMFEANGWAVTQDLAKAHLLCFTGGEDVTPALYGENKHPLTRSNLYRDIVEMGYFSYAQRLMLPCVGVCRGGQFLTVMCGGSLHQHIEGHCGSHGIVTLHDEVINVTSTHHQVMIPGEGIVLARAQHTSLDASGNEFYATEVWKSKDNHLMFQPHPEYVEKGDRMQSFFFECLELVLER